MPGGLPPSEAEKKNAISKLNLHYLVHTLAKILLKIHCSFPIRYWLILCLFLPPFHYFFMMKYWKLSCLSSHLSCFDAFVRAIINLWPLKRKKGVSEGECPPLKLKKCNFQTQFAKFGTILLKIHYHLSDQGTVTPVGAQGGPMEPP